MGDYSELYKVLIFYMLLHHNVMILQFYGMYYMYYYFPQMLEYQDI
jgi:hypothetical protein